MPYQRKYERGERILSLDELSKQKFVYWRDKITPRGWFMSWQLNMAYNAIGPNGRVYYAIRKEQK